MFSSIFLSVQQPVYPEVEILWLMTKAWNTGIYAYGYVNVFRDAIIDTLT